MRQESTCALSPSRHRREARTVGTANLIWVGLLISLPCFPAETPIRTTDKTLLTTNVVWQGFTNVSRFDSIKLANSNTLLRIFTNASPLQTGMWFRLPPTVLPKTNSTKEQRELLLKIRTSLQQNPYYRYLKEPPSNRLGDYWLPGEFERIIERRTPATSPNNPRQL